jgi:multicomponent Na+:H+ antiporter subunit D
MIGTPPLAGFISKWFLGVGALQAKEPIFIVILLLSTLLGAVCFLPIIYIAFFREPTGKTDAQMEMISSYEKAVVSPKISSVTRELQEVPLTMIIPIMAGAAFVIILGLFATTPGLPLSLAVKAVSFFLK